jgi:plastocyanin
MAGRRALTALVTGAAAAVAWAALGAPATAGGGCHRGLTEGRGDTVEMAKVCFTPSVLRVAPGTEVTFVNRDPLTHNVSANGWSTTDDLVQGEEFTATFARPGVYPFACTYHPGMVGAIVVGSGPGAGAGDSVEMGTTSGSDAPLPASGASEATSPLVWVAAGAAGLIVGAVLGLLARRRSSRSA